MNFKKLCANLFSYTPQKDYHFELPKKEETSSENSTSKKNNGMDNINIFPSISVNLDYIKTKYNILINSDIILREFTLNARDRQYNAFLIYIDGMVNSQIMDDFILKPLMLRNRNNIYDGSQNKIISEAVTNNITIRKVKKFDLSNYLMGCLMPQNGVKQISSFEEVANGINSRKLCTIC